MESTVLAGQQRRLHSPLRRRQKMPAKIRPGLMESRAQGGPAREKVKEQMSDPHGQS